MQRFLPYQQGQAGVWNGLLCLQVLFWVSLSFWAGAFSLASSPASVLPRHEKRQKKLTPPDVTVFVAGDVLLGRGSAAALRRRDTPLQWLAPQSRAADIAFCNLECVLTASTGQRRWKPLLFAPPPAARCLHDAGISVVSVANNHTFDAGENGAETTLEALRSVGIAGIGTTKSKAGWPIWEKTCGSRRVAWLAASVYGPWQEGQTRMRSPVGSGLTDQVRFLTHRGIVVFVSLHWGNEYSWVPTAGQKQLAHRLLDAGAAAVVGHHPHVVQPVEVYRGRPIFYSLGNFVFDRRADQTQDGLAALISVAPSGVVRFRLLPLARPASQTPPRTRQALQVPLPAGETLIKMLPGHFLKGAGPQIIVWSTNARGNSVLRVFVRRPGSWRCLAEGHHPRIFDMQVGSVEHNGQEEIVLGLLQRAKLDIRVAPRLYIYSVGRTGVFEPRWRGSGLSRAFRQFWLLPSLVGSGRQGDDIVALEKDGRREYRRFDWLSVYRWNGFGLWRLWTTPVQGSVQNVCTGQDKLGSFMTFTQVLPGIRRRLILRPVSASINSEDHAEFIARVVQSPKPTQKSWSARRPGKRTL